MIEQARDRSGDQEAGSTQGRHEETGRLAFRLEAARADLEEVRDVLGERQDLRDDVERAITELEEAIARAAPRFQ